MQVNLKGRTPDQSGIKAGTITPFIHTQGNGKKVKKYRLQYPTQYLNFSSYEQAKERWSQYVFRTENPEEYAKQVKQAIELRKKQNSY